MTALLTLSEIRAPSPGAGSPVAADAADDAQDNARTDAWNTACRELVDLTEAPSDWVECSLTARRSGIDVSLLLSWGLYAAVRKGSLGMKELMGALAAAGRAAARPGHSIELGTELPTVATCLGDVLGKPVVAIRLGD